MAGRPEMKYLGQNLFPTYYDAQHKWWHGKEREVLYHPDCSLGNIIFNSMKNWPRNVCQISDIDGETLTNAQALTWCKRIALQLKTRGMRHEDIVGILAKNGNYTMPLAVGCFFNATPFLAINYFLTLHEHVEILRTIKPKIIFCDYENYEPLLEFTSDWKPEVLAMQHIEGVPNIKDWLTQSPLEVFYVPEKLVTDGSQVAAIICSSGTTGFPKAICMSHNHMLPLIPMIVSDDVLYCGSGLDWLSGIWNVLMCTVNGCTGIVTDEPFSPPYFVQLVKKYGMTAAAIGPWHASVLIDSEVATTENLASMRMMFISGGWVSTAVLQEMQDMLPNAFVLYAYGMTETGVISCNANTSIGSTVGKIVPGLKLRIIDEDNQPLTYNQTGEVLVDNGRKWHGYYGNLAETQSALDAEGWFHTGDLGYFDDNNNLHIIGRKNETVTFKSMQYWPNEIEQVIARIPEVRDVCVVSVFAQEYGSVPGAVVVRKPGAKLTAKQVKDHVYMHCADFKRLRAGVIFVDELPQNRNGKIVKKLAIELFKIR